MNNKFLGFIGITLGVVGVGYTFSILDKMNKIYTIVEKATNDLSKTIEVDISNEIIERAVNRAVENEVGAAIERAADRGVKLVNDDIQAQVRMAITSEYNNIKDSVNKEIARRIGKIDISEVKNEVIRDAKAAAAEKLNDNLDDILEKFNDDLDNVGKIYRSIAKTFSKGDDREMIFKIS